MWYVYITSLENKSVEAAIRRKLSLQCCKTRGWTWNIVSHRSATWLQLELDSFYDWFDQKCSVLGLTESGNGVRQLIKDEQRQVFCYIMDNISDQMKAKTHRRHCRDWVQCMVGGSQRRSNPQELRLAIGTNLATQLVVREPKAWDWEIPARYSWAMEPVS